MNFFTDWGWVANNVNTTASTIKEDRVKKFLIFGLIALVTLFIILKIKGK